MLQEARWSANIQTSQPHWPIGASPRLYMDSNTIILVLLCISLYTAPNLRFKPSRRVDTFYDMNQAQNHEQIMNRQWIQNKKHEPTTILSFSFLHLSFMVSRARFLLKKTLKWGKGFFLAKFQYIMSKVVGVKYFIIKNRKSDYVTITGFCQLWPLLIYFPTVITIGNCSRTASRYGQPLQSTFLSL